VNLAVDPNTSPGMPGTQAARITAENHCLVVGDEILIIDTDTIPSINGLQRVTEVITEDIFEIGVPIKVVNNQVVTTQLVLGSIKRSLDEELGQITNLTLAQDGFICTGCPHNLTTEFPDNKVWIGNIVGGLTEQGLAPINGIQTVGSVTAPDKFNIAAGIIYEGFDNANAFVVKTSSDALQEITSIIPANNGRFCPVNTAQIFTGPQVPEYVLFQDTETTPDIDGTISVDVGVVGNCENLIFKTRGDDFWQSFTATVTGKLVDIYVRVGEGENLDGAQIQLYEGEGTSGNLLASSLSARVDRDVCTGAHFCMPSVPLVEWQQYTWSIDLTTRMDQQVAVCVNQGYPYPHGRADLNAMADYDFCTMMSPGVQEIDYYSQTSGKFDLMTSICAIDFQNPNQSYVRSLDAQLRCIQDAVVASNGIWTFATPHGCSVGDRIFVSLLTPPGQTTEPFVNPNIVGIHTVALIIDSLRLSTSTTITSSTLIGSEIEGALEVVKTSSINQTNIINIYPISSGYLCKDSVSCDPSRENCVLCPCDLVVIRGGSGNVIGTVGGNTFQTYETDLVECDVTGNIVGNVFGCYKINQIFTNTSAVCDVIFDFRLSYPTTLPILISLIWVNAHDLTMKEESRGRMACSTLPVCFLGLKLVLLDSTKWPNPNFNINYSPSFFTTQRERPCSGTIPSPNYS
jgi:hypothetical protein